MLARALGAAAAGGARVSTTVVAAVVGLVIGSFLNVVVYRVPRGLSVVQPGSFCPACGTPIRPGDNVPVLSWLVLRARCRHCGEPISARYPVVEVVTGALFGAVAWMLGAHWAVPGMCALAATTLALAAIELDGLRAPASVSLIGTGLGAALLGGAAVADGRSSRLVGMLIGIGVALFVVVAGSWVARRRGFRLASLWALVPAGAVMGWAGLLGAGVGLGTSAVVLVGLSALVAMLAHRGRAPRSASVAVVAAAGSALSVIAAFVSGSSLGA